MVCGDLLFMTCYSTVAEHYVYTLTVHSLLQTTVTCYYSTLDTTILLLLQYTRYYSALAV